MSEVFTYDSSADPVVIDSVAADEADSLEVGEALMAEHESMLAGKYKNAQELEQAYIELQKKLGDPSSRQEQTEEDGEEEDVDSEEEPQEEEEEDYQVNLLLEASEQFAQTGELSEETMEAFSQLSSQELVQAYLRMQEQNPQQSQSTGTELSEGAVNQIKNSVGGEAAYNKLVGWAADNFSQSEVSAFDSIIESGDMNAINLALQALYFRYTDAMGFEGDTLQGKPAKSSTDVFRSQAELVRAMSDPRYENDPAYRQDLFDKLERSDLDF